MIRKVKGQASMEYLIVIGFALTIISILMITYFVSIDENRNVVSTTQITKIVNRIVDNAEEVYYLGPPAKTTMKIYLPQDVDAIIISPHEINIRIERAGQITDIEAYSQVNLTGSLPVTGGIKFIELIAMEDVVCIQEQGSGDCI